MSEDTKPAPFNVGDHVRYVAAQKRELPAGKGNDETQLVLVPGMEGVILLSTGAFSEEDRPPNPWRCQVQFPNGFQLDITTENCADFEIAHDLASAPA